MWRNREGGQKKWCSEFHHLNSHTFRHLKKINDIQKQIIMFGRLGDGHITKGVDPIYIESHAEDEREYLFWKYEILKDICNKIPTYYEESYVSFGGNKQYLCKPTYKFNTRVIDDLRIIRDMDRMDIVKQLNELGLALHLLDDGNRDNLWHICFANWSIKEKEMYIKVCKDKFGLNCYLNKDSRYAYFDAASSRKIDSIILNNIPNKLDIIKKKIINNKKILKPANYIYIICSDEKCGLNRYCRNHNIVYKKAKNILEKLKINEISENDFLNLITEAV